MAALSDAEEVINLYATLIGEAKYRLLWLVREMAPFADLEGPQMLSRMEADFWYIQLRRVTELVALAVLAAHADHEDFQAQKFMKEFNPRKIIKEMSSLNPAAYPRRAGPMTLPPEPYFVMLERPNPQIGERIAEIFDKSADFLHIGNLKKVIKERYKNPSYTFVREATIWLAVQLQCHCVITPRARMIHADLGELSPEVELNGEVRVQWRDQVEVPPEVLGWGPRLKQMIEQSQQNNQSDS